MILSNCGPLTPRSTSSENLLEMQTSGPHPKKLQRQYPPILILKAFQMGVTHFTCEDQWEG